MPAYDGRLRVAVEVDTSGVTASMAQVKSAALSVAEAFRQQGISAKDTADAMRQLGFRQDEIRSALSGLGAAASNMTKQMSSGFFGLNRNMMDSIRTLRTLRILSYSTLGLLSVGFYINEWARLAGVIKQLALNFGGATTALQDFMAASVVSNEKLIMDYKQLNAGELTQLLTLKDIHQARIQEIKDQIANAEASQKLLLVQQKTLESTIKADQELIATGKAISPITGMASAALVYWKEKVEGTGKALDKTDTSLVKVGEDILSMRRELQEAQQAADKPSRAVKSVADRAAEAIATARAELPPFIREINRLKTEAEFPDMTEHMRLYAASLSGVIPPELKAPRLGVPAAPAGMFGMIGEGVKQLTAEQRAALPTQREYSGWVNKLAREFPELDMAQIKNIATINLQNKAYRNYIDSVISGDAQRLASETKTDQAIQSSTDRMTAELQSAFATRFGFQKLFAERANAVILQAMRSEISGLEAGNARKIAIDARARLSSAKTAAANTWEALSGIPFIGPFIAPPAAAAAFAGALAFARGGIVPETSMALVHKNEMVLPAHLASFIQRSASHAAAPGGAGDVHLHYSASVQAIDTTGAEEFFNRHAELVGASVQRYLRSKNRT